MILYPAIDLKDGQCVRLLHGDMDKATVFNASPGNQAERFVKDGFDWLHVVDLNGAIEGASRNAEATFIAAKARSVAASGAKRGQRLLNDSVRNSVASPSFGSKSLAGWAARTSAGA